MSKRAVVIGTGMYAPTKTLTNADLEHIVDTSDEWIYSRTGIRERRIAADDEAASDLATNAARAALESAGRTGDEVDLVIVATVTPDHTFPATACLVQHQIGAKGAGAFDLSAACSGFTFGIATAAAFLETGTHRLAVVVGSEVFSRITDWSDRSTCVLFGDGSGAVTLEAHEGDRGVLLSTMHSDGSGGPLLSVPSSGSRMPPSHDTVDNRQNYLQMHGPDVYKFGVRVMVETILEMCERASISPADVTTFVPHQANVRIIAAAAERLAVPMEKMVLNMDRYGNTSSATIPIALAEADRTGRLNEGDLIMTIGFGAGLTWGANLIRW